MWCLSEGEAGTFRHTKKFVSAIDAASWKASQSGTEWFIPGLIRARNVTLLYGDGGTVRACWRYSLPQPRCSKFIFRAPGDAGKGSNSSGEDEADRTAPPSYGYCSRRRKAS